jgi:heterodisulfide reductase subunit B
VNSKYKTNFNIPVLYITQLIGLALGLDAEKLGLNTNIVSPRAALEYAKTRITA